MNCPICNEKCKSSCDMLEGTTLEASNQCPNDHYFSYFGYGGYEEKIGDKHWFWYYTDSLEVINKIKAEIKEEIEKFKFKSK